MVSIYTILKYVSFFKCLAKFYSYYQTYSKNNFLQTFELDLKGKIYHPSSTIKTLRTEIPKTTNRFNFTNIHTNGSYEFKKKKKTVAIKIKRNNFYHLLKTKK